MENCFIDGIEYRRIGNVSYFNKTLQCWDYVINSEGEVRNMKDAGRIVPRVNSSHNTACVRLFGNPFNVCVLLQMIWPEYYSNIPSSETCSIEVRNKNTGVVEDYVPKHLFSIIYDPDHLSPDLEFTDLINESEDERWERLAKYRIPFKVGGRD